MTRRYVVLAPNAFESSAKTAHGVIRYGLDPVVAVIDPSCAGRSVREALAYLDCDAPIVANLDQALVERPTALLIGTAPIGGELGSLRAIVREAIDAKLDIVSGLHTMLSDDIELAEAARRSGVSLVDLRSVPESPIFSGAAYAIEAPILLTVGNDCNVGKMSVALELCAAAERAKRRWAFVPTGQTGIAIAGWGTAIDRTISDFAAGASEQLVLQAAREHPDAIVVEGQGAINHPAYGAVTLALMYGCAPDGLLLVCAPHRRTIKSYDTPTLRYRDAIRLHEALLASVKPARVLGIALNTYGLTANEARDEIERARSETGLPADDLLRFGGDPFYAAVAASLHKQMALAS
ncbi:MAG TPA: DUF1611 domain-containing protein [Candidatus Dormibacteraeota bacterium]|nr:DUF1611 domain-containing protein [Candidatus Dormibacteraeota bacterium]